MNRVGQQQWKQYTTPVQIIQNTGFDAYIHKNKAYTWAYSAITIDYSQLGLSNS